MLVLINFNPVTSMQFKCLIFLLVVQFSDALVSHAVNHTVRTANIQKKCTNRDIFLDVFKCPWKQSHYLDEESITYVLYDVNPGEGFNLRRDVYIRLAVFLQFLRTQPGYKRSQLVLPMWSNLVHWRSNNIDQMQLPWSHFFDLQSMKSYTKVIDMPEFLAEYEALHGVGASVVLNEVYKLNHFDNMFDNGVFFDKFEEHVCAKSETDMLLFYGYKNFTTKNFRCMFFQGSAILLHKLLETYKKNDIPVRYILLLNAEIVLHDLWGNTDYWEARRSMRFAQGLVNVANHFRWNYLNSADEQDGTTKPNHWRDAEGRRQAKGGEYICAHLRRADFLFGREKTTPTIQSAALQIRAKLLELGLKTVFIASDCSRTEFYNLKNYLKRFRVLRFVPEDFEQRTILKDGGIAIVDQIICSHAYYFIGTYESTFTYRIYEEREIIGFPIDLTFNTFCKSEKEMNCVKNNVWPIVYV